MKNIRRLEQEGFTLIEVMVALVIFAVGILAVNTMQIKSIQTNTSAGGMTQAMTLAQDKVEELMVLNIGHVAFIDTDADGTNQDIQIPLDGIDDDGGFFGLCDPLPPPGVSPRIPDFNARPPDFQEVKGIYNVCWNVALSYPSKKSTTIRVVVTWNERGRDRFVFLDYVKSAVL